MANTPGEGRIPQTGMPSFIESGWAHLEPEADKLYAAMRAKVAEQELEMCQLFRRVLDNPDGRQFLEELHRICYFHPGFDGTLGFETAAAMGIERGGMMKLIHFMQHRVNRALEGG